MRLQPIFLGLLFTPLLGACGGAVSPSPSPPASTQPQPTDSTDPTATPSKVCDGSDGIRLVLRVNGGGGPQQPGDPMMFQNGGSLLTIDGHCHYVAFATPSDARTGTLSASEETQLVSDLSVDAWKGAAGSYSFGGCDATESAYRFADAILREVPQCGGAIPATTGFTPLSIDAAATAWTQRLAAEGTQVTGGVRALTYVPSAEEGAVGAGTAAWPLASQPTLLTAQQALNSPGVVFLAADAASLRALATGVVGVAMNDAQGERFVLLVRDVLPDEGADGVVDLGL